MLCSLEFIFCLRGKEKMDYQTILMFVWVESMASESNNSRDASILWYCEVTSRFKRITGRKTILSWVRFYLCACSKVAWWVWNGFSDVGEWEDRSVHYWNQS